MPQRPGYEQFFPLRRVTAYSRARAYCHCSRSPIQTAYIVEKSNELAKTRVLVIDDEESIRYAVDAGLNFLGEYDVHFAEDDLETEKAFSRFSSS